MMPPIQIRYVSSTLSGDSIKDTRQVEIDLVLEVRLKFDSGKSRGNLNVIFILITVPKNRVQQKQTRTLVSRSDNFFDGNNGNYD